MQTGASPWAEEVELGVGGVCDLGPPPSGVHTDLEAVLAAPLRAGLRPLCLVLPDGLWLIYRLVCFGCAGSLLTCARGLL